LRFLLWFAGLGVALVSLTACQQSMLDKALRGRLSPEESNEVITKYCQSCHIHRTFDPSRHVPRIHTFYDRPPYTVTTECRVCHLVREDTWGIKRRKTLWPAQVAP
jgi:cytochrome c2